MGGMGAAVSLDAAAPSDDAKRDSQLLAMIHQQEASRAAQVAQLRDNFAMYQVAQEFVHVETRDQAERRFLQRVEVLIGPLRLLEQ